MHPPLSAGRGWGWGAGGVSYQIFKKGGLTGPQFLEEVAGKEWGDLSQERCNFYIKKPPKI